MDELVVLVDEHNTEVGTAKKSEVHGANTPMHRAFSSFLFTPDGKFLVTQRSHTKKTWPLVWSNSCCGHPAPGESFTEAVKRRVQFELGVMPRQITMMVPNYTYQYVREGVMEHEFCPVLVARIAEELQPNPDEIESFTWTTWAEWRQRVAVDEELSEWCRDETRLLDKIPGFHEWLHGHKHP